jgi:hypothetical protein
VDIRAYDAGPLAVGYRSTGTRPQNRQSAGASPRKNACRRKRGEENLEKGGPCAHASLSSPEIFESGPATRVIVTSGEIFPDGSILELVASETDRALRLLLWEKQKKTVASQIEHGGHVYGPPVVNATFALNGFSLQGLTRW